MGRIVKNWLMVFVLAGALILAMTGCKSEESVNEAKETEAATSTTTTESIEGDNSEGGPVYGGTLVSYFPEFYSEFDPSVSWYRQYVSFYTDMLWNIEWETDRSEFNFEGSYINSDYIAGQIAESWEMSEDFTSMTVHLREDVYFQDKTSVGMDDEYNIYGGRQFVASDVKWTYDRLLGLDGAKLVQLDMTDWPSELAMLDAVEVIDDHTVKFHFNTSTEIAINQFMCAFINLGGPEWDTLTEEQKTDWHYATGTGPFIMTDCIADNSMTFTANPNYFGTDKDGNKLPYLETVKIVHILDEATRLSSFLSGELDIISTSGALSPDSATVIKSSLSDDEYTEYNTYSPPMGIALKQGNNPVEALSNEKVRLAMQYAIDREALSAFMGFEYPEEFHVMGIWNSAIPYSDIDAWDDGLYESYVTYDPEYAKELLAEAGYPDGFEFDCTIFAMLPEQLFSLAGDYLAEVGIKMNLAVGNAPPDMTSIGGNPDDPGCIFSSYGYESVAIANYGLRSDGFNNHIHHNDAEIDTMLDEILNAATLSDQIATAKELDNYVMSEHYLLELTGSQVNSFWHRGRVQGLHGESLNSNYYYGFMYARTWLAE